VSEASQLLLARPDERAPDAGSPLLRVDVDREELAVGVGISARADTDEAHDLAAVFCDERRRPSPVPFDRFFHGQRLQLLGRQGVGVGGLPGLDLNTGNAFRVGGCTGANHRGEPTLPGVKRIALLGATGSIGRQALEIVDAHPELGLCAAASGSQSIDGLAPLTQTGGDLTELLEQAEPDLVLNAVVGFAGLPATLWALERGVDLALANKESLVAAGELARAAQLRGGGRLIPVDSEHSGAFQCLEGRSVDQVHSLVLTASGGPFRGRVRDELEDVMPAAALAHPTWNMGPKITVDSATLANKGLELIEAHFLFGLPYDQIEVVVHPTSVVHALVRLRDGATLAHLGYPDMRVPISYALTYPERGPTPIPPLDLAAGMTLEFEPPDLETFPLLAHARAAGEQGGTYPCVFNAANEVAVAAFLEGRLPFLGIAAAVADALAAADGAAARDLDDLVAADEASRRHVEEALKVA
jgi:1-deoxy-D-xylulose-5-phosphate reductoisomerase